MMETERPCCFADLETVFPMGEDGLRHSPPTCMYCHDKTDCLRQALSGQKGLKVREENLDRAWESGRMSFMERWSQRKLLHQKRRDENTISRKKGKP
ncbi:MAG: hypothetical protein CSB33_04635 [Desulfobacterales bacterium]|nr:MAG: hypothetical protein CSB33_04635 [Desulfobacterales bacterium]